MTLRLRLWLIGTVLVALAFPASSFVNSRHPTTGNFLNRTSAAVTFLINDQTVAGLANSSGQKTITSSSNPLSAIQAGLATWNTVATATISFGNPGTTAQLSSAFDGQNIISFVDNAANRQIVGDALAVTVVYFTQSAQIGDTDILFNPDKVFSTDNGPGTYDLQTVVTHELGHSLGAGHSGLLAATMFQATKLNSTLESRLTADDIAFATSLYPRQGVLAQLGQITGSLLSTGGAPIFGGLVVAVDPNTGVAVGNISGRDGAFTIPAVPPGTYYVYAEPADGPVGLANLPAYFAGSQTAFQTVFLGSSGAPETVALTAGQSIPITLLAVAGPPTMNTEIAATTTVGGSDLSNAFAGPQAAHPADALDLVIAGRGLDNPAIQESSLLLVGAGLRIKPGSFRRGDFIAGKPGLRMTVEVTASAPYETGAIIIKGDTEGVAMSALLKIFVAGPGGGGALPGTLTVTPSSLKFTGKPGSQVGPQTIAVGETSGLNFSVSITTTSGGNWLLVTPQTSTVPATLTVFAIADDLPTGTYSGRITVSAPNTLPQSVDVTFDVVQPLPTVFEEGIVNAATFVGGGVVAGEIVSVLGSDLGPLAGVTANLDQNGRLPTLLSDVLVYIGGIPAPLFFVRHDQINAQVPYELAGQQVVDVVVQYSGRQGQKVQVRMLDSKPGIFTVVTGAGQAAALNQDNTYNAQSNPAPIGSVIQLFLTGGGTVCPPVATGQAAPSTPPFPTPAEACSSTGDPPPAPRLVTATIGGVPAAVQFAGLAPGAVGVLQVNLVVPTGFVPLQNVPVIVTVGGAQSPTNATIAVR
ncbi:MAG: matrixin family metalloprotease [Acidobacteria bacterium]|nr:matrixin family metalloprotease [Acidobacteriota bacterium]